MSQMKVRALDSGYLGNARGGHDQIFKGQEFDADHPLVKSHPGIFGAPYRVEQVTPPPARGRRG